MAAKKDKMIPSEKERKRALKYATPAGTGRMWVTMGIAFIIFGIILLLIPIGLAISEASAQRYDPESIHTATLVFYLLGAFFGFCGWKIVARRTKTMNEFKARSTLGSEAVPVFDDDGELTEWLHRDNYTVEELELMNFVGDEKPVIKKDGVKIIRDGTVIRRTNTETRKTEFLFIPRIVTSEQKTV